LTAEELSENERLWREENDEQFKIKPTAAGAELRSAGITPTNIQTDITTQSPEADAPVTPPATPGATPTT